MIGKAPRAGSGIKGLVSYLMFGKRGEPAPDRVRWTEVRNLGVDDPGLVPRIMRCTANHAGRCDRPFYHFVVAWRHDENPTDEQMRLVGDTTLADLNLLDHQTLFVAHRDTRHRHLHVVVNRVHPETGKAWDRWQDWVRLEKSLARQAKSLGFVYVPGRHNAPRQFEQVPVRPRSGEYRMAERLGTRDQLRPRWTKAQIAARRKDLTDIVERSKSWDELARALAAVGLTIKRKGQGLVIGDDNGTLKLSDLGRQIRLGGLEERFAERFADYEHRRDQAIVLSPPPVADGDAAQPQAAPPIQPLAPDNDPSAKATPQAPVDLPDTTSRRPRASIPLPPLATASKAATPSDGEEAAEASAPSVPSADQAQDAPAASARKARPTRPPARHHTPPVDRTAFVDAWQRRAAETAEQRRREQQRLQNEKQARHERRQREAAERRERAKAVRPAPPPAAVIPPAPPSTKPQQPQRTTDASAQRTPDPGQKTKSQAYDAKAKADAAADLAHTLHGAGLVTRKQLARAVRERERAQAEVDKHAPAAAKFKRELRQALTPDAHAQKPKLKLPPKSKDDGRER